ncbi:Aste57867_2001 [Aphanomyces stellatus]|uniref:Aste57867_2001 protein n=1 Tax=Aphanomyces stellatus TaxID=120398 RepID=A0A485K7L2_9STRA|nr:hypothetical protein As57867_001999 [Aphanomyces stellatus]VFT79205.1 Aste57867_2001 [Aphanomyces stellatus]
MSKRAKPGAAAADWVPELTETIARYIVDPDDIMNYLDALEPTKTLGDLHHLLHLLQKHGTSKDIWPRLRITPPLVNEVRLLKAVVKFFSHIELATTGDVSWLCLAPATTMHLTAFPTIAEDSTAWYNELTRLPITHITWKYFDDEDRSALVNALPRLPQLKGLTIEFENTIAPFLEFISTSTLHELHLGQHLFAGTDGPSGSSHDYKLMNLTKWIRTQSARTLTFPLADLRWCTPGAVQAFLDALSQSTTLTTFVGHRFSLSALQRCTIRWPWSLEALYIDNVFMNDADDAAIVEAFLHHSNLKQLEFNQPEFSSDCFRSFLDRLPPSLERLTLRNAGLSDQEMQILAKLLPTMAIVKLNLSENSFEDPGVYSLAEVLDKTSIEELCLDGNNFSEAAGVALIESTKSKPRVFISLRDCGFDEDEKEKLAALVRRQGVRLDLAD